MGKYRTESERRRAVRQRFMVQDRQTLFVCPACDGQGRLTWEEGVRYRSKDCKWCFASGAVDYFVMKLFNRWLRLRNTNARCGAKNSFPHNK